MSAEPDDLPTASLYLGDETWHDGSGWYWIDDEYPEDTGMVGAFATPEDALAHVRGSYRLVMREAHLMPGEDVNFDRHEVLGRVVNTPREYQGAIWCWHRLYDWPNTRGPVFSTDR